MKMTIMFMVWAFVFLAACSDDTAVADGAVSSNSTAASSLSSSSASGDTAVPVVSCVSHTNGQVVGDSYTLAGICSDSGSGVRYVFVKVDEAPWMLTTLAASNWSIAVAPVRYGPITNRIFAIDYAGNLSATGTLVLSRPDTRDKIAPGITITSQTNNAIIESPYTLGGTFIEGGSGIRYVFARVVGGPWTLATAGVGTWSVVFGLAEYGIVTNEVFAIDNAGNYSQTNSIVLDYRAGALLEKSGSGAVAFVYSGANYVLTATADSGWIFSHWQGDAVTTDNPATVATNERHYEAVFLQDGDSDGWPALWESGLDGNAGRHPETRDNIDNNGDGQTDEPTSTGAYPYVFIRHPQSGATLSAGTIRVLGEDSGATSRMQYSVDTVALPADRVNLWSTYQVSKRTFAFDLSLAAGSHTIHFFPSNLKTDTGLGYASRTNQVSVTFTVE